MRTIGVLLLAVAGLGGCHEAKLPVVPPLAKAGQHFEAPCSFKQGKENFPARCGILIVPENRTKAGARPIALPYMRILAQTKTPGAPAFYLAGGPGQTNLALPVPATWFLAKRDVVMLGYRGVDGGARLDCPEVNDALKTGGLFAPADIERLRAAFRRCAVRFEAGGTDLSGYTVLETVDDLEAARRAFGYGRIDLLAISYGTRLALIYGWRYPGQVEKSALIGVNPPGRFHLDSALLEAQMRRYAQLCAADAGCASRTNDLAADMKKALQAMPRRWLGFPVDRDGVLLATYLGLYSTNAAASVFDMWIAAAHGDYSGMALVSVALRTMSPPMVMGDVAAKGLSADFGSASDCRDILPGRTLIGVPLNVLGCAASAWPASRIPGEYRRAQASGIETLMLGGSLDVATPPETAKNGLLPLMPHARQVVMTQTAHAADLLYQQKEATHHLLATFFDTGQAEAHFVYKPVNFDPGWLRLPLIAKALFGAGLVLAAPLLWLAIGIVRRIRRRFKAAPG
jgi:pimeloyl-ACP methyl ester carboxylesterase